MEGLERGDRSLEMKHALVNHYPALLGDVLIEKIFLKGPQSQSEKVLEGLERGDQQLQLP